MKIIQITNLRFIIIIFLCLNVLGCSKTTNTIDSEVDNIALRVNLIGAGFDEDSSLELEGNIKGRELVHDSVLANYSTYDESGMEVMAELIDVNKAKSKIKEKLATTTIRTSLPIGTLYKLVAFKSNGTYVKEMDYVHGQEATAQPFYLEKGSTYSLIVYSVQSSSVLPALIFDSPNKTISNCTVDAGANSDKFLRFRKDDFVMQNSANILNIVLKPMYSQLIVEIDAESEGNITVARGFVKNLGSKVTNTVSIDNGTYTNTTSSDIAFNFTGSPAKIRTSDPIIVIPRGTNKAALNFSDWEIESVANPILEIKKRTDYTPFNDLDIKPGYIYKLKITVNPDRMIDNFRDEKAVRINGKIWMQYNVGANKTLQPNSGDIEIVGNYYIWGRYDIGVVKPNSLFVEFTTTNGYPAGYWSNEGFVDFVSKWWNDGSDDLPIKKERSVMVYNSSNTNNGTGGWTRLGGKDQSIPTTPGEKYVVIGDPCPKGWRVPTHKEYSDLVSKTNHKNAPATSFATTGITVGVKLLESKKRSTVSIPFPAGGRKYQETGNSDGVGVHGNYWASLFLSSNQNARNLNFTGALSPLQSVYIETASNQANYQVNLRCIADMRQEANGKLKTYNTTNYDY